MNLLQKARSILSWRIQSVSWNKGLIIDLNVDPFDNNAFAGLPGVVFQGPRARTNKRISRTWYDCLLKHERTHWLQWAIFTALSTPPVLVFGWWPTWTLALAPLTFPTLYLLFPPFTRFVEDWADEVQEKCNESS